MFGLRKIQPLVQFLLKTLTRGISAGKKIVETYRVAEPNIHKLRIIIATLEDAKGKIEHLALNEDDAEIETNLEI